MDYDYYHHDYYYDDYHDYSGWDEEYGGDDYDYDESYWEDDYWYDESPEYYNHNYDNSQEYMNGYHNHPGSEGHYGSGSEFSGYHDNSYNHEYSRDGNYQYAEGAMHNQSVQRQHGYYGSNSWSVSETHHTSHSHVEDHHTSREILPLSPAPPLPPRSVHPESPTSPDIAVLSLLRASTPSRSSGLPTISRALDINRHRSLSVKPIDSQSTKSARTPTPTESFFHNLFWKSPARPRARSRPTTPVVPSSLRQLPHSPNLPVANLNRPPSAAGNSPIAGYDATRGKDIGFLAPSPERP